MQWPRLVMYYTGESTVHAERKGGRRRRRTPSTRIVGNVLPANSSEVGFEKAGTRMDHGYLIKLGIHKLKRNARGAGGRRNRYAETAAHIK